MLERRITEDGGIYSHEFFLAAGECNAECRMPLPMLVSRLIRVATEHANVMNLGFSHFAPEGRGWVLTRLAVEMSRYPQVNENYTIKTWMEEANKLLSFRAFSIHCGDETVGYVRSEWAIIDMRTRRLCDISAVKELADSARPDVSCPIAPPVRLTAVKGGRQSNYTFGYCDVDFNRHVNTVRYIERLMDQWPIEHYDRYQVSRFDVTFMRECHYGATVEIKVDDADPADSRAEIAEGAVVHCRARFRFSEFNAKDIKLDINTFIN